MKTFLFCIMLMLPTLLAAQTIENPSFKARTGSVVNITRIERTPEYTRLYIHAIFRPHWWIKESGNSYLEDASTGKKYKFLSADGIEINKEVYMPDSGEMDYTLTFEALPEDTQVIHLLSPSDPEGNTFDISLLPQTGDSASPLAGIKGNWFGTDDFNAWEFGIYDSITIMNNRIYSNEDILKKGKKVELTLKDKQTGAVTTLAVTPQKDGSCKIQADGAKAKVYTQQKSPMKAMAPDAGFQQFLRRDTAHLQGYINGYDPRLGFDTGIIYLSNVITNEDYPTVVEIDKDGSFNCKFVINHPVEQNLLLNNYWLPFYIEPGQTLTMYIDWEDILARNRARDYYYPIKNTAYMGPSAPLTYLLKDFSNLISYRYDDISHSQKTLTPSQYRGHMKGYIAEWEQKADSIIQFCQPSGKAVRLLKNKIKIQAGSAFFDFLMSRDYYAEKDPNNEALKAKADDSYYDFLKQMPLDDETALADNKTSTFFNRFEFMDALRKAYTDMHCDPNDIIEMNYEEMPLLTFLKEKGVKLNEDQEAIRLKQEERAGKKMKITLAELIADNEKVEELYKAQDKLVKEWVEATTIETAPPSQAEIDKSHIVYSQSINVKKDSIIAHLANEPNPFFWQITKVHDIASVLRSIKTPEIAKAYIDSVKLQFTQPALMAEANQMFDLAYPKGGGNSYQLPEGKATDIFRNIIKNHPGKVLFVDFWGTTCGPCRGGIEATAALRDKYRNHPDFEFIYISGERESPENAYREYVEKHLKEEATYYVTATEYNYLRQLFQFNGIPHYELVEKDGSISKERLSSYNIEFYLQKHFPLD